MKICPVCSRAYADDSLSFCFDDGSALAAEHDPQKTLVLQSDSDSAGSVVTQMSRPQPPPTAYHPAPTMASPQPTMQAAAGQRPIGFRDQKPTGGGLKLIIGIIAGIVLGIGGAGLVAGLILFNRPAEPLAAANQGGSREAAKSAPVNSATTDPSPTPQRSATPETATPTPSATSTPKIESTPKVESTPKIEATPTPERPKPDEPQFGPMSSNISLNGTNLTYYRGSTAQSCQADCARNPRCNGFTFIRPGGYNPGDPPMCYLIAVVSGRASHSCCISGVKR